MIKRKATLMYSRGFPLRWPRSRRRTAVQLHSLSLTKSSENRSTRPLFLRKWSERKTVARSVRGAKYILHAIVVSAALPSSELDGQRAAADRARAAVNCLPSEIRILARCLTTAEQTSCRHSSSSPLPSLSSTCPPKCRQNFRNFRAV